jgi:hypothetical protein
MWKSQESERRLREVIEGRRDRWWWCGAVSSSRPNLAAAADTAGPEVTNPGGFASRILGACDCDEELPAISFINKQYAGTPRY